MAVTLKQVDLIAKNMDATLAFYRAVGLEIPDDAIWRTPSGIHHVDVPMPDGLTLHFDSAALAAVYNRGWREPTSAGSRAVITFKVTTRNEVDAIHDRLTRLGHRSSQPPWDAFWGARYTIVEDPDGNPIGFMSESDPARRRAPPDL